MDRENAVDAGNAIAVFKGRQVRRTLHEGEWWFSVNDVIQSLTDSLDPAQYFKKLRERDPELGKLVAQGGVQFVPPLMLELKTAGGKQKTYCWNTEGIFRLAQSIPSPRAEPFKRWLAKVGFERVKEIENPELATKRTRLLYKLKGYSDDWIEKRMRGIAIREELTDEWQKRGAEEDRELIFTMLGERATTEIHRQEDSQGVPKLKSDARAGGAIAGKARKALEKRLKRPVVSPHNYLATAEKAKRVSG